MKIWSLDEKFITLHLICGTSCKVAEKDAISNDMRTEMAARIRERHFHKANLTFNEENVVSQYYEL